MVAIPQLSQGQVLVTGATGFIGRRLIISLQRLGITRIRVMTRSQHASQFVPEGSASQIDFFHGDLLSRSDCVSATNGISVIYHLAAGTGTKSFADAFLNSVVTTRNLVEGALTHGALARFVNVSTFSVYSGPCPKTGRLNEQSPIETEAHLRDAYCYAKCKQDELVRFYGEKNGLNYVLVRPGVVYGPGKARIHGRIGIDTFGIFLHLGGSNRIPLTYVDNCADAIALAGLRPGIDGSVINIVDDDLPTSGEFLAMYKRNVRTFPSLFVPKPLSYFLCYLWERYASGSHGQLPPAFTRREWKAYWKKATYSNDYAKSTLNWKPAVSTDDGLKRFFDYCRDSMCHA